VFKHYGAAILASPVSVPRRLDIIGRLLNSWGSAVSIPLTFGALPAFVVADRLGMWWPLFLLYTSLLVGAVCMRIAEALYVEEPAVEGRSRPVQWLRMLLPTGLILNMGMTAAWTQGTLEGLGHTQRWEVTPKSGSFARAPTAMPRVPSYIVLTMASAVASLALWVASLVLGHFFAAVFYLMMVIGSVWVAGAYLREHVARRAAVLAARASVAAGGPDDSPGPGALPRRAVPPM
jgi:hypothetical protein